MKRLAAYFIATLLAGGASWALLSAPGYVLLAYREYTVETSLIFFAWLVVVLLILGYVALRLLIFALRTPARTRAEKIQAAIVKAKGHLDAGLLQFLQGRYAKAQDEFIHATEADSGSTPGFMLAACAAQLNRDTETTERLLAKARAVAGRNAPAVMLFEAECLLDQRRFSDTQAVLKDLRQRKPDDERLLWLEARCLRGLGQRAELKALLPSLRASESLDMDAIDALAAWTDES